jgi:hypothetical protein
MKPTAAPMIASGMTSQFAQPRNGRNAIAAKIKATMPMMIEMTLNIRASFLLEPAALAERHSGGIADTADLGARISAAT